MGTNEIRPNGQQPNGEVLAHLAAARVEVSRQLADIKAEARQAVQRWQKPRAPAGRD